MSLEALSVIAELLGALGVIVSLIYLSIQVRSGITQGRQSAAQSVQGKIHSLLETLAANAEFADVYARGTSGLALLSRSEAMQVSAFYLALTRAYEELRQYYETGTVDYRAWASVRSTFCATASSRGFSDWWDARGDWFSEEFRKHIATEVIPKEQRDLAAELTGNS